MPPNAKRTNAIRASPKPSVHQPSGGITGNRKGRNPTSVVVRLEDGGSVLIVIVVEAATPPESAIGEGGLNEHPDPATVLLQVSATELDMLVSGIRVNTVDPRCPAVIVGPGPLMFMLKPGRLTWTNTEAQVGA